MEWSTSSPALDSPQDDLTTDEQLYARHTDRASCCTSGLCWHVSDCVRNCRHLSVQMPENHENSITPAANRTVSIVL
eukprot:scaffold90818_cov32-Prasinocladus_malaysianus.AAC.1